jgi:putative membrane protein
MTEVLNVGVYFLASAVVVLAAVFIFDLLTKYKIWDEVNNGNLAVAMSTGGLILGVANIMKAAVASNDSVLQTLKWGGIGAATLIIVYFLFELFTPKMRVSEEIGKGNKAVGLLSLIYSLAFSLIIGACIS